MLGESTPSEQSSSATAPCHQTAGSSAARSTALGVLRARSASRSPLNRGPRAHAAKALSECASAAAVARYARALAWRGAGGSAKEANAARPRPAITA
eukprot:692879-Prorocentrum_minimum.AAC.3